MPRPTWRGWYALGGWPNHPHQHVVVDESWVRVNIVNNYLGNTKQPQYILRTSLAPFLSSEGMCYSATVAGIPAGREKRRCVNCNDLPSASQTRYIFLFISTSCISPISICFTPGLDSVIVRQALRVIFIMWLSVRYWQFKWTICIVIIHVVSMKLSMYDCKWKSVITHRFTALNSQVCIDLMMLQISQSKTHNIEISDLISSIWHITVPRLLIFNKKNQVTILTPEHFIKTSYFDIFTRSLDMVQNMEKLEKVPISWLLNA